MRPDALSRCEILTMAFMPKRNPPMSTFRSFILLATLLVMTLNTLSSPVKLIWDTDFMSDCDDPGALGMLHALADNGEVEILATFSSGRFAYSPAAIDAVNTYYGRGHIPVATTKDPTAVSIAGSYAQHLAQNFPHDTPMDSSVPDAVDAYRELLAGQADHSVVIVTVGYATNLKNLLASGPDRHSPLDGTNLITAKVVKWVNMGGNFEDYENNDTNVNWTRDKVSAVTAIRNWPTEIVFNGREIGHLMRAGARLSQTPATNPVHAAYKQFFGGTAKDQHCADPSATLYAVRGLGPDARKYWALDFGRIQINDDATFVWSSGATGPRTESRMISARTRPDIGLMTLDEVDEIVEDLMIQAPLGALPDAPSAPSTCTAETNATVRGLITLTWAPCTVAHPASWVAGYEVRRDGALVGKALGPRFVDTVSATGDYVYRIQAYTPSGVLGEALEVPVHVERVADKP